jgi:hypothetical protein
MSLYWCKYQNESVKMQFIQFEISVNNYATCRYTDFVFSFLGELNLFLTSFNTCRFVLKKKITTLANFWCLWNCKHVVRMGSWCLYQNPLTSAHCIQITQPARFQCLTSGTVYKPDWDGCYTQFNDQLHPVHRGLQGISSSRLQGITERR